MFRSGLDSSSTRSGEPANYRGVNGRRCATAMETATTRGWTRSRGRCHGRWVRVAVGVAYWIGQSARAALLLCRVRWMMRRAVGVKREMATTRSRRVGTSMLLRFRDPDSGIQIREYLEEDEAIWKPRDWLSAGGNLARTRREQGARLEDEGPGSLSYRDLHSGALPEIEEGADGPQHRTLTFRLVSQPCFSYFRAPFACG